MFVTPTKPLGTTSAEPSTAGMIRTKELQLLLMMYERKLSELFIFKTIIIVYNCLYFNQRMGMELTSWEQLQEQMALVWHPTQHG